MLLRNELPHAQMVQVQTLGRDFAIEMPPDSVGTLSVKPG